MAEKYQKDAKDAPELRTRVVKLESDASKQARKLADQEELLETMEGRKAADILRRYERAWYVAVLGWGVALVLALGLLAAWGSRQFPVPGGEAPTTDPEESPPHRIA